MSKLNRKLLQQIHHNYFKGIGACYINTPDGGMVERAEFNIFFDGDIQAVDWNRVNIKTAPSDALANIHWWQNYWGPKGRYKVIMPPELEHLYVEILTSLGYKKTTPMNGMALLDLPALSIPQSPFEIKMVTERKGFEDFKNVIEDSYGFGEAVTSTILEDPDLTLFVAYVDNVPAATSLSYITQNVVGVFWVGTAKHFRHRGLGAAITWRAVYDGIEKGCIVASLQASDLGKPVYERMGFQTLIEYPMYEPPLIT
jgi:Acetyltransferase (GNAT) domain